MKLIASVAAILTGVVYLVKRFFPAKTEAETNQEIETKQQEIQKTEEQTGRPSQ